jgi:hypothetical protein
MFAFHVLASVQDDKSTVTASCIGLTDSSHLMALFRSTAFWFVSWAGLLKGIRHPLSKIPAKRFRKGQIKHTWNKSFLLIPWSHPWKTENSSLAAPIRVQPSSMKVWNRDPIVKRSEKRLSQLDGHCGHMRK